MFEWIDDEVVVGTRKSTRAYIQRATVHDFTSCSPARPKLRHSYWGWREGTPSLSVKMMPCRRETWQRALTRTLGSHADHQGPGLPGWLLRRCGCAWFLQVDALMRFQGRGGPGRWSPTPSRNRGSRQERVGSVHCDACVLATTRLILDREGDLLGWTGQDAVCWMLDGPLADALSRNGRHWQGWPAVVIGQWGANVAVNGCRWWCGGCSHRDPYRASPQRGSNPLGLMVGSGTGGCQPVAGR